MNKPTHIEIENELQEARDHEFSSAFPGMTYEQGVIAALEWVLGENDTKPMED